MCTVLLCKGTKNSSIIQICVTLFCIITVWEDKKMWRDPFVSLHPTTKFFLSNYKSI